MTRVPPIPPLPVSDTEAPIVIIIDDDPSFRRSTERLLRSAEFKVLSFVSAIDFLKTQPPAGPTCLVLDVRMPGLNGLELQDGLARLGIQIPIIFITGHGDIAMSVRAMKAGAIEFLTKPFLDHELITAVRLALDRDRAARQALGKLAQLRVCYDSLTPRERQVMTGVISGKLNKQIAGDLGTSEKTVKFHRAHIMRKMQVQSVADLVRLAEQLGSPAQRPWS